MQTNWRLSGKQLELMIGRNWMEGAGKFHTPRVINCWWLFIYLEIKLRNIVNQYFQFDIWGLLLIWRHIYIIIKDFLLIFFVRHLLSSIQTSSCDSFFFLKVCTFWVTFQSLKKQVKKYQNVSKYSMYSRHFVWFWYVVLSCTTSTVYIRTVIS